MASSAENFEAGRSAYRIFFAETVRLFPNSPLTAMGFDGFISYVKSVPFVRMNNVERLGDTILYSQIPLKQVDKAMKQAALAFAGRVPDSKGSLRPFQDALIDQAMSISYLVENVVEGAKQGVKELGQFAVGSLATYALVLGAFAVFMLTRSRTA